MITHVAIRFGGKIWSLPKPNRHHHIMLQIIKDNPEIKYVDAHGDDQGFLNEDGEYLTRAEAFVVAKENGQLRADRPIWYDELYSENLW